MKQEIITVLLVANGALLGARCRPPGPTPVPTDTDKCVAAEARLESLGCLDRKGNPMWVNLDGERFGETCRRVQEQGKIALDPKCIAAAASCKEANSCPPTTASP